MSKTCIAGLVVVMTVVAALRAGEETKTLGNLQKAYANGSLAKAQCEAFAAKAKEEGYKSAAALFRAAAKAESIHLDKYAVVIKALGGEANAGLEPPVVKTTKENLDVLRMGIDANMKDYADFIKTAEEEKNDKAVMFLKGALADEESRAKLYKQAADDLDNWKAGDKEVIVCLVCGYTTIDPKLKTCPVCSAPRSKFEAFK